VDHESRVHDADAFPSARMNAEDASPRDEAPPAASTPPANGPEPPVSPTRRRSATEDRQQM